MKNKVFNDRGFGRMMDAFEGAPRGSIRLTADACEVARVLKRTGADGRSLFDSKTAWDNFEIVLNGGISTEDAEKVTDKALEDLEYECKCATRHINRIRNTAIKVARFRKTGSVR